MTSKLKKIIAREGLVLIAFIASGLIFVGAAKIIGDDISLAWLALPGLALLWLGYPMYLFVRFIIWAIKTLRSK